MEIAAFVYLNVRKKQNGKVLNREYHRDALDNKLIFKRKKNLIMSAIRNQVQLIGNLGKKPEIKTFGTDKKFATFSVATSDYYYDNKGDRQTQTQWHNVVVWGKQVDVVEKFLDKGSEVALTGKIVYRQYEDKEGVKRTITEINANDILLLGKKN
ncbi:MAG TPA: single-stranded DNA-binding protein [Chitinophagales bacterium]|nr:single-stranded DNA-binding protein [Chitinophagales bacterium]